MWQWDWLVDVVGVALVLALLLPIGLIVRRRMISRSGTAFELSVNTRSSGASTRGWTLGLGRYREDQLDWFRFFSLAWRPKRRFHRDDLEVVERRTPHGPEAFALYSGHIVVEFRTGRGPVQLAMSEPSLTALLAWLESAPPGRQSKRVV
jgi:Protein of unknown function (DUF2550)